MLSTPPSKKHRGHPVRRGEESPPAPPVALTLVSASYDTDDGSVTLAFDRAVDVSALIPSEISVDDGVLAAGFFIGSELAAPVNPTTIKLFLEQNGPPTVSDIELSATAATGIVAVDDGGTLGGAAGVVLPFP